MARREYFYSPQCAHEDCGERANYRSRYGYPAKIAMAAEFWWRLERLPYRGGNGGFCGYIARFAYRQRKAWERRGVVAKMGMGKGGTA